MPAARVQGRVGHTDQPVVIVPQTRMRFNPTRESSNLFVPGLMAFVLTIISSLMTAISLTREKETGTMETLLVSPLRPWAIIVGKVAPYLGIGFISVLTVLLVARVVFSVPMQGSLTLLLAEGTLFILVALSLGILVSARTSSQRVAMLGALTRPTEGKLLLDGTDVWTLSEAELATFRSRRIGFIFQFPSLLSNLTAVDNVAVPALLGRTMDAGQAYARAYDLLARVGLRDRADAYPGSMSGGEQRRVAIARALINSPPLLLADEPTSDLDEDTETDIIDLLERLLRRIPGDTKAARAVPLELLVFAAAVRAGPGRCPDLPGLGSARPAPAGPVDAPRSA